MRETATLFTGSEGAADKLWRDERLTGGRSFYFPSEREATARGVSVNRYTAVCVREGHVESEREREKVKY